MILNWTLGSFFRTIGKIIALIFIGFILLFLFGKVKALQLNNFDLGYNYVIPSDCKSFFFYTKFGSSYLVCSSDDSYLIEQPYYNTGLGNPNYFKNYRVSISESLYNDWLAWNNSNTGNGYSGINPLIFMGDSGIGYYDNIANEYYAFYGNPTDVRRYSITYNSDFSTTLTSVGGTIPFYGILAYASNVNSYLYSRDGLNEPQSIHYAPYNIKEFNVTFHLNGGTAITLGNSDCDLSNNNCNFLTNSTSYYNDFSLFFEDNISLQSFIGRTSVKNDFVTFNQWYYDEQLTQPYNFNNILDSDIDLYASYEYISVDSIINNINFNQYTFNSPNDDYQYAVISVKNNFSQGLYIGLDFNFQYLDSYRYIISNNAFEQGISIHLDSIGFKDNKYYYHLGHLNNETSMVVVIDKANLITLGVNNELEHYYDFLVSDNCYVYFTNDLTQVSYYIPTSNGSSSQLLQNQDISSNYDYTQKIILESNSDIITKFISLINNGDFSIFNFVTILWAKIRAYKILNYFMIISLGGIIIALIKGGSRH